MDAGQVEQIMRGPGALYDYLVASAHDGFWVMNEEGEIFFADEILCQRWGRSNDWFAGKSCFDMARTGERDLITARLDAAACGECIPSLDLVCDTDRGESIQLEVNITRLREGGRVVGLLAVCRDVTQRKRAEEELETYRNSLMALVEKRTQELLVANEQLQREISEHKKTEEALRTSEEYYRAIFQNTGTAMVIMEEDTTIALVNRESVKFVGYTPEQLEGQRKAIGFVAPGDFQKVSDYHQMRLADPTKPPKGYEFTIIDRYGVPKDIYMTIELIPEQRKIIASFLDISERKRMESALKESEEKYRNIFEHATEGIFQTSPDGRVLSANPAFARILGYRSPAEMISSIKDVTYEVYADPHRAVKLRELVRERGLAQDFEIQCRRPDGTRNWISLNVRAVRDRDGLDLFYEGTIVDIAERKRMQEDLEAKSRSLEETNAALRVLLKHREQDNSELEEKVLYNIRELVLPYVEKLRNTHSKDAVIVDIIESNLHDILTPFIRDMASKYADFTPKEIQIADLIKKGKTTKEISQILNLSMRTIDIHRYNIRRKLDITNTKANLQSYLLSFA